MRPFQIALLAGFGLLAVIAIIFLSIYQSERKKEELAYGERVVIWGTLSESIFKDSFQEIAKKDKAFNAVSYIQVPFDVFESELVNAIAEGRSPDMIVLQSDALVKLRAKLLPIPYDTLAERDFRDAYVDGAEIFAFEEGTYGLPFAIDPMVMYWNRDMFASNGIAQVPATWEAIVSEAVPRLTVRDNNRNVLKSAVAFGEYRNIVNAKNILMLLALQSGSKMVLQEEGEYKVQLNQGLSEGARAPFEAALQFYADFSNVNSPLYSWNRSLSSDKDRFLAGDLGLYFGLGSEYSDIGEKNPNLNYDIAAVPQGAGATALRTSGHMYAFALPRASKNVQGAYAAALMMTHKENVQGLVEGLHMSPARRDLIAAGDENFYRKVILQSALITRSWLDPDMKQSDGIFLQMVEDVVSNRARIGSAVGDAVDRLILAY